MSRKPNMAEKSGMIGLMCVFVLIGALFAALFLNCVALYSEYDVGYEDLQYGELTFEGYEKKRSGKSGSKYEIYFAEYEKPMEITSITKKELDEDALAQLLPGQRVQVYFSEESAKHYDFSICELKAGEVALLRLEGYVDANRDNQVVGMIVCPCMGLCCLLLIWIFFRLLRPTAKDEVLGKVRIEYQTYGHVIQVYNAPQVCSLVIDGQVVDQYFGMVAANFSLWGEITFAGRTIPVEARMGQLFMALYCDDRMVHKRFMGLG